MILDLGVWGRREVEVPILLNIGNLNLPQITHKIDIPWVNYCKERYRKYVDIHHALRILYQNFFPLTILKSEIKIIEYS